MVYASTCLRPVLVCTCCPVLQEERDSFGSEILGGAGLVDAWRAQHPGIVGYTYYSFRGPNGGMRVQGKGWRLDYTLVRSAKGRELALLGLAWRGEVC